MPSLAMELEHLALADKHIAQSKQLLVEAEGRAAAGQVTELSRTVMETMRATLAAHEGHRALIVENIAAIQRGELPGADLTVLP